MCAKFRYPLAPAPFGDAEVAIATDIPGTNKSKRDACLRLGTAATLRPLERREIIAFFGYFAPPASPSVPPGQTDGNGSTLSTPGAPESAPRNSPEAAGSRSESQTATQKLQAESCRMGLTCAPRYLHVKIRLEFERAPRPATRRWLRPACVRQAEAIKSDENE